MGGFDMPNNFSYEADVFEAVGTGVIGIFALVYVLVMFMSFAFSTVSYVLHSLGLYTLAERRGIRNGWLAWIPFGNLWILGSISDQYQYLTKGRVKSRRKVLLALEIGVVVVCMVWVMSLIASMIMADGVTAIFGTVGGMLLLVGMAILLTVLQYMAYYDLFCSCQPSNAVLYLVLSILFPVTLPFFVFFCRKKDLGMPPRKKPAQTVVIPTVETVVDPNVVEKVVIPTVEPVVETAAEPVDEGFAQPEEFVEE